MIKRIFKNKNVQDQYDIAGYVVVDLTDYSALDAIKTFAEEGGLVIAAYQGLTAKTKEAWGKRGRSKRRR